MSLENYAFHNIMYFIDQFATPQVNSGRYHGNYIQCKKRAIPKSLRWIDFVCCLSSIWCVSRCWFVTSKRLLPHLILLSCRLVTRIGFNQTRHSQPYKLRPSKLNQYHLIYSFQACEVEKALKRTKYLSCVLIIVFQKWNSYSKSICDKDKTNMIIYVLCAANIL